MAANWIKVILFVSSISPLLVVFALLDSFGRGVPTIVCLVLAVAGPVCLYAVLHVARRFEGIPLVVGDARRKDADVLAYVATYLIPFLTVDAVTVRARLAVGIFIALIGLFYIRGEMYFLNPLLGLVGYRVFEIRASGGEALVLITRRRHIGVHAQLRPLPLADYIYWEPGREQTGTERNQDSPSAGRSR